MWLGIAFLVLGIAAVVLQAWLWNPKYWDEVAKKTRAPKMGLRVHRWVGIAFTVIYVVMMWNMLPRLWEYQVELPARTVIHAVAAIVLGVLLATKLIILRWFRHFEESMPALGFGIMTCTILLATLSVPFAARAQGLGIDVFTDENTARVEGLLASVEMPDDVDRAALVNREGLMRGRRVLVDECTRCHDMRTILAKPRTADAWYDVNERMAEKPSVFGRPIDAADVPFVTAYLVAITPEIQESRQLASQQARDRAEKLGEAPVVAVSTIATPAAQALDKGKAKTLLQDNCTQCHELDEIIEHGGDDALGWAKVTRAMIDEGAELDQPTAHAIVQLLATEYPKK
jgi:cytochrome c5